MDTKSGTPSWQVSFSKTLITWLAFVVFTLTVTIPLLWFNYVVVILAGRDKSLSTRRGKSTNAPRQTILITGSATPYGLEISRALHRRGYRIVGADVKESRLWSAVQFSRAVEKHYDLPEVSAVCDAAYVASKIVDLTGKERAVLWLDFSQNITPRAITAARKIIDLQCSCVTLDEELYNHLGSSHSFHEFLKTHGIPATEHHEVRSRRDIHRILNGAGGKKQFMLQSADGKLNPRTLLPRRTLSQTYQEISLLQITSQKKLLLEENIASKPNYTCFAVIVRGVVTFARSHRQAERSVKALEATGALSRALTTCVAVIARELGDHVSCHLTINFGIEEQITEYGVAQHLAVASASLRPTEGVFYVWGHAGDTTVTDAYLSAMLGFVAKPDVKEISRMPFYSRQEARIVPGHDLLKVTSATILQPNFSLGADKLSFAQLIEALSEIIGTLVSSNEVFYDFWDPFPTLWQCSVVAAWSSLQGVPTSDLHSKTTN